MAMSLGFGKQKEVPFPTIQEACRGRNWQGGLRQAAWDRIPGCPVFPQYMADSVITYDQYSIVFLESWLCMV